jgi:hypothetical protein
MIRPPKPGQSKRLLQRKRMTICIAAVCQQDKMNEESRIVLCSDWKSETEFGGSETSDKMRTLPKGWVALMADILSRGEELVAQYETHLREMTGVMDDKQLFEEMKKPAHKQKEILANDYLRQTLGVSYADLVSPEKRFPESIVEERLNEVAKIRLRSTLILAGFISTQQGDAVENHPYLFVVDDQSDHEDVVRNEQNFAAIGSGSYVAIPVMHQRIHDDQKSLMETIYSVYEAKRLSEVVPGVGEMTSLDVMYPDGRLMRWSDEGLDRCNWLFERLGPKFRVTEKKATEYFEFNDEYLEPFDADETSTDEKV